MSWIGNSATNQVAGKQQSWKNFLIGNEKKPVSIWTLLHFIVGIVVALLGFPFIFWLVLQIAFEILENSVMGLKVSNWVGGQIQNIIGMPPWEDYKGDSLINSTLDVVAGSFGWVIGSLFRK